MALLSRCGIFTILAAIGFIATSDTVDAEDGIKLWIVVGIIATAIAIAIVWIDR